MFFKQISILAIAAIGLAPYQAEAASRCSLASHYGIGDGFHGQRTASGERYNAHGYSVAHRRLPFGTKLLVTNQSNNKSVIVRVNDRGPFVKNKDLDLSYGAFISIASPGQGSAKVCYTLV